MIRKSGYRFSEKIMTSETSSMIPKSGSRFSEKIMRQSTRRLNAARFAVWDWRRLRA
jgi:hypothetical protein